VPPGDPEAWQRLDIWLWHARIARTRSLCTKLVGGGVVRVNRQPTDKPHTRVRPGDMLTLALGTGERGVVRVLRVVALSERRGPAPEARLLYEEIGAP
jgi:ribosome-associated heat shock protein Hsp15